MRTEIRAERATTFWLAPALARATRTTLLCAGM